MAVWTVWVNADQSPSAKYWIFLRNASALQKSGLAESISSQLHSLGVQPVAVSHWLNAISATIPIERLETVKSLPFVRGMQPVAAYRLPPLFRLSMQKPAVEEASIDHNLSYGYSLTQNQMINVPAVHDLGITGKGVRIGMIDAGFRYRNRSVFYRLDVLAEHDFHFGDGNTANETGDPYGGDHHGSMTLAVVGGYEEDEYIGTAFEASFALAKTEWISVTDLAIEEDHWIEGLEWLVDSLHVQVVSSSVGYNLFVDKPSYTVSDMDGNTCLITVAADLAVKKGVTVVVSAGNERNTDWKYIIPPADGDSVIAVGAVTSGGNLAYFSSLGPTADGRIKPDVVAMGVGVYTVDPTSGVKSDYISSLGTSFTAPQVAGVCALLKQARPEMTPMQIRDAIRMTANRSTRPDTMYGWGLVDAVKALFYHGPVFTNFRYIVMPSSPNDELEVDVLAPSGMLTDSLLVWYRIRSREFASANLTKKPDGTANAFQAWLPRNGREEPLSFYIAATGPDGANYVGPLGVPRTVYTFDTLSDSDVVVVNGEIPDELTLFPNYPNPFNAWTNIVFDIRTESDVSLTLYNLAGQTVTVLHNAWTRTGKMRILWDGRDSAGKPVVSGIYICVLKAGQSVRVRKITCLR